MSSSSIFTDTPRDKVSSVFCTFFIPVKDTHPIAHQKVISDLKEEKKKKQGWRNTVCDNGNLWTNSMTLGLKISGFSFSLPSCLSKPFLRIWQHKTCNGGLNEPNLQFH